MILFDFVLFCLTAVLLVTLLFFRIHFGHQSIPLTAEMTGPSSNDFFDLAILNFLARSSN